MTTTTPTLAVLLLAAACADQPVPADTAATPPPEVAGAPGAEEGTELETEGGTIRIEADERGLVGSYRTWEGTEIRFETLRGAPKVEGAPDAEEEPYELDARFLAASGEPFLVVSGGSALADPSWTEDLYQVTWPATDDDLRALELALAWEVGEALRERPEIPGLPGPQLDSLARLGQAARPEDLDELPGEQGGEQGGEVGPAEAAPPSTSYRHKAHIYYDSLYWTAWLGDHSAVKVNVYSSGGSLRGIYLTSNHGRDPSDSSMSTKCYKNFSGRSSASPMLWDNACDSSTTYGITSGHHVCNDDTYAEYANVKYDSASSWATCGDSSLRLRAPSCF